jgi:hypothetical protein
MARLKGEVETAEPLTVIPSPSLPKKVQATVDVMRKSGAPESDIEDFLLGQDARRV